MEVRMIAGNLVIAAISHPRRTVAFYVGFMGLAIAVGWVLRRAPQP